MLVIFSVPVKLPICLLRDNGMRGKHDRKALLTFTSNPPLAIGGAAVSCEHLEP
jgi:hypothetical protein